MNFLLTIKNLLEKFNVEYFVFILVLLQSFELDVKDISLEQVKFSKSTSILIFLIST